MTFIWDYDKEQLSKTEQGRVLLLERAINYGPGKNAKIKLTDVKRYWNKLNLFPNNKRLMQILIWNHPSSTNNRS